MYSDEETVPMLSDFEALPTSSVGNGSICGKQRRSVRFTKTYLSFVAFLVFAYLSYFYVDNHSFSDETDITTLPLIVEEKDHSTAVLEPIAPTLSPTLRPGPSERPVTVTASPSQKPSQKPIWKPTETILDTSHGVETQRTKRNLVLHIGPQKTGSTTLQDAWSEHFGILSPFLKMDNYLYRFIHPSRGFFDCDVNSYGAYIDCKASGKLKGLVRIAKNEGNNLLLSDENLDERFPEALRNVIDDNDWNVTVIVVYRRIHMWLHSWYDQIHKTTNKDTKGNILIDENGQSYREEHTMWPDEGGEHIPTFTSWYKDFTRYWDSSELVSKHRSIAFMNAFKPFFNNIVVHNIHQDGDLVTNFMCDSVPDATHSCALLKSREWRIPRDNQSVDLEYDILATKARENGILKTNFKRKYVASRIQKFVTEKDKRIPRVCDKEIIDEIKNWLWDSEKAMFPGTWSEAQESNLKQSFDGYFDSGKLCDIDFEEVFANEEWLEFFQSLDNRPHLVLHIGPQKTGSTTLQYAWDSPKELRNVLSEDNFYYHSINPHQGMFDCDLIGDRWDNCKASQKLKVILSDAKQQRKNLILSDENLDERFVGTLRIVISDKDFRVKVVLVYRRIHQWLPSWYSQIEKTANKDSSGNSLRNENGQPERMPHTKWPNEGGVYVPNFTDWYKKFVARFHSSDLASHHPSVGFKKVYEPHFDHIEVYDMTQNGDFVTNFMCQMIPQAFTTCQRLRQGSIDLPRRNPSVNVEHDILSVQAYEHGLVEKTLSRSRVVEEVRKHLLNPGITLPRHCDNAVKDQIHGWLFASEMAMFPESWTPEKSEVLDTIFDEFFSMGKLCDIDIESILGDEAWIQFFSSLR